MKIGLHSCIYSLICGNVTLQIREMEVKGLQGSSKTTVILSYFKTSDTLPKNSNPSFTSNSMTTFRKFNALVSNYLSSFFKTLSFQNVHHPVTHAKADNVTCKVTKHNNACKLDITFGSMDIALLSYYHNLIIKNPLQMPALPNVRDH